MCHSQEDPDELLELQLLLDSGAGPARRISRQQALEMVRAALERAPTAQPLSLALTPSHTSRSRALPRRARSRRSLR